MEFFYSLYELKSDRFKKREGALLRVEFAADCIGYADCHPWVSLGDACLSEQLQALRDEKTTKLTARSLYFARLDADARSRNTSLFNHLEIPPSHFLLQKFNPHEMVQGYEEGFQKFKVKASPKDLGAFEKFLPFLENLNCQLRVDFNRSLSFKQYLEWLKCVEGKEHLIDFFEDPFADSPASPSGEKVPKLVPLAADFSPCTALTDIRIIKPAIECVNKMNKQKIVVTSYLDHPLGQLTAAYTAAKIYKNHPDKVQTCGLLSHRVFEKTLFSEQLSQKGPTFTFPTGTGFGFDELLEKQEWKKLNETHVKRELQK